LVLSCQFFGSSSNYSLAAAEQSPKGRSVAEVATGPAFHFFKVSWRLTERNRPWLASWLLSHLPLYILNRQFVGSKLSSRWDVYG